MAIKIARDKWKHFYVGILMGIVLQAAGLWLLSGEVILASGIVLVIVIAISYGFELFSLFTGMGHYDFWDAVASIIGGVVGMTVAGLVAWVV